MHYNHQNTTYFTQRWLVQCSGLLEIMTIFSPVMMTGLSTVFENSSSYPLRTLCWIGSSIRVGGCKESCICLFPYKCVLHWASWQQGHSRGNGSGWDRIIRMSARCMKFWFDVVDQANINIPGVINCTHKGIIGRVELDFVNRKYSHSNL